MALNALVDSFWPQPTIKKCENERVNERYCLNVARSFHNVGPTAKKLLSPNLLCIRGTTNVQMSFERDRSVCQQLTAVNSRPRCKQALLQLVTDKKAWRSWKRLAQSRWQTGSQSSCRSNGVMWSSHGRASVTKHAAPFCTDCKRRSLPYNSN